MKISKKMTIGEFAAFIASHLQTKGISSVLTGGAVVSIYTKNKYMSSEGGGYFSLGDCRRFLLSATERFFKSESLKSY